jgi:hypothetical protein
MPDAPIDNYRNSAAPTGRFHRTTIILSGANAIQAREIIEEAETRRLREQRPDSLMAELRMSMDGTCVVSLHVTAIPERTAAKIARLVAKEEALHE